MSKTNMFNVIVAFIALFLPPSIFAEDGVVKVSVNEIADVFDPAEMVGDYVASSSLYKALSLKEKEMFLNFSSNGVDFGDAQFFDLYCAARGLNGNFSAEWLLFEMYVQYLKTNSLDSVDSTFIQYVGSNGLSADALERRHNELLSEVAAQFLKNKQEIRADIESIGGGNDFNTIVGMIDGNYDEEYLVGKESLDGCFADILKIVKKK